MYSTNNTFYVYFKQKQQVSNLNDNILRGVWTCFHSIPLQVQPKSYTLPNGMFEQTIVWKQVFRTLFNRRMLILHNRLQHNFLNRFMVTVNKQPPFSFKLCLTGGTGHCASNLGTGYLGCCNICNKCIYFVVKRTPKQKR